MKPGQLTPFSVLGKAAKLRLGFSTEIMKRLYLTFDSNKRSWICSGVQAFIPPARLHQTFFLNVIIKESSHSGNKSWSETWLRPWWWLTPDISEHSPRTAPESLRDDSVEVLDCSQNPKPNQNIQPDRTWEALQDKFRTSANVGLQHELMKDLCRCISSVGQVLPVTLIVAFIL